MVETALNILSPDNWALSGIGPLYVQLRQKLEEEIVNGTLKPGDPLPTEREIADLCGVSRVTVRKAVHSLVVDGLVVQRQGSGTRVSPQVERVEQSLSRLTSFTEDMARRGKTVRSVWVERGIFPASPREMMALGLRADAKVSRIARLRIADDVPMAIERASLSTRYLPDPDKVNHSLYEVLAQTGDKPVRAIQRISATNIEAEDAQLLEIPAGSAGLKIERVSYSSLGAVIEVTSSIYRGDTYDFVAELKIGEAAK